MVDELGDHCVSLKLRCPLDDVKTTDDRINAWWRQDRIGVLADETLRALGHFSVKPGGFVLALAM